MLKASTGNLPRIRSTSTASFKPARKLSAQSPRRAAEDGGKDENPEGLHRDRSVPAGVLSVSWLGSESGRVFEVGLTDTDRNLRPMSQRSDRFRRVQRRGTDQRQLRR